MPAGSPARNTGTGTITLVSLSAEEGERLPESLRTDARFRGEVRHEVFTAELPAVVNGVPLESPTAGDAA